MGSARARGALFALVLLAATLAAYAPALRAGFIWDDPDLVLNNPHLRSVEGLGRLWLEPGATTQYYPLTFTSLWVNYQLGGIEPFGYHLTNVLLHVLGALLVWRVLVALAVPGAWLAAAVFALHPLHVESVAWVTERKNVLSGVLYLSALLAYLRFAGVPKPRGAERGRALPYWALSFALYAAALGAKTVTASLPVAILLVLWWKRGRLVRRDVAGVVPFLALGVAAGLLTVWMERHHVGASGPEWDLSLAERLLVAGRALWFYAGKLFWPEPLVFVYPRWRLDAGAWWQWSFPLAAGAVALGLVLARHRLGAAPLAALAFYGVTLFPALGFFDVYPMRFSFVADHFVYLASLGLIVLAAASAASLFHRNRLFHPLAGALLALLGVLTWRQAHVYRDLRTLWEDTLARNPECWMAHNNLGLLLFDAGEGAQAIARYREALRLKPDYPDAHNNLGNALAALGQLEEAAASYRAALAVRPRFAPAENNLGAVLVRMGRGDEAVTHYRAALDVMPEYTDAHSNLGAALAARGETDEARRHFVEALRIDPGHGMAHNNLGALLLQEGATAEAVAHFSAAIRINPNYAEAYNNLGNVFAAQGQLVQAAAYFERALQLRPDYTRAQENLARVRAAQGVPGAP